MSVLANQWRIRAEFARVRSSSPEFARVRGERQFAGYTAQARTEQVIKCVIHGHGWLIKKWDNPSWRTRNEIQSSDKFDVRGLVDLIFSLTIAC